jgi:hypothetical protein
VRYGHSTDPRKSRRRRWVWWEDVVYRKAGALVAAGLFVFGSLGVRRDARYFSTMSKVGVKRSVPSGRFLTRSGRLLMNPVRGGKLSAADIERAVKKLSVAKASKRAKLVEKK